MATLRHVGPVTLKILAHRRRSLRAWTAIALAVALCGCATAGSKAFRCPAEGGPQWRELTSEGFVLQTSLDLPEAAAVIGQLERMRARLIQVMSVKPGAGQARLQVIAFPNRVQLEEYLPVESKGAAAVFRRDPFGREWILLAGDLGKEQQRAIAHEVSHFLLFAAVVRQPRWFGEGMATLLEAAVTGGLPREALYARVKVQPLSVKSVFEWTDDRETDPLPRYATSWLLVHFLTTERPRELAAFEERLARAEDPAAAWNATFTDWKLDSESALGMLDAELLAHFNRGIVPSAAPEVDIHPQFSERTLTSQEVHTLRLELPRAWTADQVRAEISEALAEDEGHVGALIAQAAADPRSAPGLARKAVAVHPDDARAWDFLAVTLVDDAQAAEREAALRKALELAPHRVQPAVALATYLLTRARVEEALPVSARAVEFSPWSPFALLVHARVLSAAGHCQEALSTGHHAIDVLGHNVKQDARDRALRDVSDLERTCGSQEAMRVRALVDKGAEASRREDFPEAAALLEKATTLDPRDRMAWSNLGFVYRRLGRTSDAIGAFRKQLEVVPDHAVARNGLALALLDSGQVADAEATFRRELEIISDDRAALLNLGRLLNRDGRPRDAEVPLQRLVKLEPRSIAAMIALGRAQIAAGERARGLGTLEQALRFGQGALVQNDAAYALAETGTELDRALQWVRSAIDGQAGHLQGRPDAAGESEVMRTQALLAAWDTLGWILYRQGRLDEAARYVAAAERLRESAEVSDHLGQILERLGRRDEAVRAYARALACPFPLFETRRRIAALTGDAAVEEAVRRGRAELEALHTVTVGPAPASVDPEMDVLLVFRADGTIASVRPTTGSTLPAGAERLIGTHFKASFPADAPEFLVTRARFSCRAPSCRADFGRQKAVAAP
jgi:tetratricopeptide (TPR) repeat protein